MPLYPPSRPPPSIALEGKDYRIRPLKRGDRDAVFRLLAAHGWTVAPGEQETALSWVVQHPELETLVAHEAAVFSKLYGILSMSHRPQLRLGGRVACIDLFAVLPEHRGKGVEQDLVEQALRRATALACKRVEIAGLDAGQTQLFEGLRFTRQPDQLLVLPL